MGGAVNYVGDFVVNWCGKLRRSETMQSTGTYEQDFETTFTGTFETTFTGNFIGALINAGTETIETYTLYVRTA